MRSTHPVLFTICAACLWGAASGVPLRAESAGSSFSLHTTAPVLVENTMLPPGNYVFRHLDSMANHHIVQISNEKTQRVAATILAIAGYRDEPPKEDEIDFWETPNGAPRAVRAWFMPGDNYGDEFPYPTQLIGYHSVLTPPATLLYRSAADETTAPEINAPAKPKRYQLSAKALAAEQLGSYAVITDGTPDARQVKEFPKHKKPGTIWDALAHLPLTATIAPLVGLIGLGSLALFFLSHSKKRKDSLVHE